MGCRAIKSLILLIFLSHTVCCVRISPKLDFGSNNNAPNNAKFRPTFQSRSLNYGDREHNKLQGVDITCTSGNCNVTDKQNGVATDVVVHIKTNVDVDTKNNSTEAIPDVPIIVGTKTNDFPPFDARNPYNDLPHFSISTLNRNQVPQNEPRTNSGSDYGNYPPEYRGFDFHPPYNEPYPSGNKLPLPQYTWNNPTRVNGGENYNPLEFKKVYMNSWSDSPIRQMESVLSVPGPNNPSNWRPCICPNPQEQYYQTTYRPY